MKKFSDIIGQKAIIEHLYNALRTGSISHAYILSGDAGSGRKTIANIYATALQCDDLDVETIEESSAASGAKSAPAMRAKTRLLEPCGKCTASAWRRFAACARTCRLNPTPARTRFI